MLISLILGLFMPVMAIIDCPASALTGSDGRYHINASSILFNRTAISSSASHVIIDFSMKNAFDDVIMPCHGEDDVNNGCFNADGCPNLKVWCRYPDDGIMGNVTTQVSYNVYMKGDETGAVKNTVSLDADFSCLSPRHTHNNSVSVYSNYPDFKMSCHSSDKSTICTNLDPVEIEEGHQVREHGGSADLCTPENLNSSTWEIKALLYFALPLRGSLDSPPPVTDVNWMGTIITFIYYSNIDAMIQCAVGGPSLGPDNPPKYYVDTWLDCAHDLSGFNPPTTPDTKIKYNFTTYDLVIQQNWPCNNTGYNYTGTATTKLLDFVSCEQQWAPSCQLNRTITLHPEFVLTT